MSSGNFYEKNKAIKRPTYLAPSKKRYSYRFTPELFQSPEDSKTFPCFPNPEKFRSYSAFLDECIAWKKRVQEILQQTILPVPVSLNYHFISPPFIPTPKEREKGTKEYMLCQRNFDPKTSLLYPKNMIQLERYILEGRASLPEEAFEERGPRGQTVYLESHYSTKPVWSSKLIMQRPNPFSFQTYGGFVQSFLNWYRTTSQVEDLPLHPTQIGQQLNLRIEPAQGSPPVVQQEKCAPKLFIAKANNFEIIAATLQKLIGCTPKVKKSKSNPFADNDNIPPVTYSIPSFLSAFKAKKLKSKGKKINPKTFNQNDVLSLPEIERYGYYLGLKHYFHGSSGEANANILNSTKNEFTILSLFKEFSPAYVSIIQPLNSISDHYAESTFVSHLQTFLLDYFYTMQLMNAYESIPSKSAVAVLSGRLEASKTMTRELFIGMIPTILKFLMVDYEDINFSLWYLNLLTSVKMESTIVFEQFVEHAPAFFSREGILPLLIKYVFLHEEFGDFIFRVVKHLGGTLSAAVFGQLGMDVIDFFALVCNSFTGNDCFTEYPTSVMQKIAYFTKPESPLPYYRLTLSVCQLIKRSKKNEALVDAVGQLLDQFIAMLPNVDEERRELLFHSIMCLTKTKSSFGYFIKNSISFLLTPSTVYEWKALIAYAQYHPSAVSKLKAAENSCIFNDSTVKLSHCGEYYYLFFLSTLVLKAKISSPSSFICLFQKEAAEILNRIDPGYIGKAEKAIRGLVFHEKEISIPRHYCFISRMKEEILPILENLHAHRNRRQTTLFHGLRPASLIKRGI